MMNGPFSSNLHLTIIDGEWHLGVVIPAEMAGRRSVLGVRHANGTFATCSPSILGTVSCGLSANRMEDVDEVGIFDLKGAAVRTPQTFAFGLLVFAVMTTGSSGAELEFAKIDRSIRSEPRYVAKPLYALFLMDAEGRSRHWAVLDKSKSDLPYYDVLYFDTTGNGDLTERSKRFVGKYDKALEPAGMGLTIRLGDLKVPGTELVHKDFLISTTPKNAWKGMWFRMKWDGKTEVSGGYNRVGFDTTQYCPSPKTAPVLWPCPVAKLSFGAWGEADLTLPIGEATRVNFLVGNWGSGPDTLCVVDEHFLVSDKDRLFATIIAKDAGGREVKERTQIKGHC
jgi:hypothetical protein